MSIRKSSVKPPNAASSEVISQIELVALTASFKARRAGILKPWVNESERVANECVTVKGSINVASCIRGSVRWDER